MLTVGQTGEGRKVAGRYSRRKRNDGGENSMNKIEWANACAYPSVQLCLGLYGYISMYIVYLYAHIYMYIAFKLTNKSIEVFSHLMGKSYLGL